MRVIVEKCGDAPVPDMVERVSSYWIGNMLNVKVHTVEKWPEFTVGSGNRLGDAEAYSLIIVLGSDNNHTRGENVMLFGDTDKERDVLDGIRFYGEHRYGPDVLFVAMNDLRKATHGWREHWVRSEQAIDSIAQ